MLVGAPVRCLAMDYRGMEVRMLDAARHRYPDGSTVRIVGGRYQGQLATVDGIDEATFHELGEVVIWVNRGAGAEYVPCAVMADELVPALAHEQSSRSSVVRKRGVIRTAPSMPVSLSAS